MKKVTKTLRLKSIADVPDETNLSFHLSEMIADHHANLERVGKIETLPILQICPCPSQVGDIYVFISRQNLGQSGNSKNPDRLGLSRHMKIRLNRSNRAT